MPNRPAPFIAIPAAVVILGGLVAGVFIPDLGLVLLACGLVLAGLAWKIGA
jgi:hypothetical protein